MIFKSVTFLSLLISSVAPPSAKQTLADLFARDDLLVLARNKREEWAALPARHDRHLHLLLGCPVAMSQDRNDASKFLLAYGRRNQLPRWIHTQKSGGPAIQVYCLRRSVV